MERVTAHGQAVMELREAIRFYDSKSLGLGRRFFDEVAEITGRILERPTQFSRRMAGIRRANLRRFPFYVNYLIEIGSIAIVAIAHNKRAPLYWKQRLSEPGLPSKRNPLPE